MPFDLRSLADEDFCYLELLKHELHCSELTVALATHQQIVTQSRRLTHGESLTRCKIVNAYDPTIAPICKGKSNCSTQFGRKPEILAEPATLPKPPPLSGRLFCRRASIAALPVIPKDIFTLRRQRVCRVDSSLLHPRIHGMIRTF